MEFSLKGKVVDLERPKLKQWLRFEEIRAVQEETAAVRNESFSTMICSYLAAVFSKSVEDFSHEPWFVVLNLYLSVIDFFAPTLPFSILTSNPKHGVTEKVAWEYPGRTWYMWLDMLGSRYHWTQEVIAELSIDDAMGLFQETLFNNQLDKEWQWSLTELAYPYNAASKTSRFQPLERPIWMRTNIAEQQKNVKIHKSMIPLGVYEQGQN